MNALLSHAETRTQLVSPYAFQKGRTLLLILATCMGLQMTGFVMILPLFARRFSEFGAGAEQLGVSVMAGALAGTLAAPLMGAWADRFGRRVVVLGSLAAYILTFGGYLLASSAPALILLRALAAAFTAGLVPAVIGIVADIAPSNRRAQWIGIVSGGASFGWIAGPILGGAFYDGLGYNAAVSVSILMGLVTFLVALFIIPKTRKAAGRSTDHLMFQDAARETGGGQVGGLGAGWLAFRGVFAGLAPAFVAPLSVSFAAMFAWALIEPRFMFYAYDDLGWNSSRLGLVMSTYGIALMLGEFGLGQLSDRLGRKPVIVVGVVLFTAQFLGLAFFRNYIWISVSFIVAGLGNALFDPALTASIMDLTPPEHQARIQGVKSTVGSLGTILGPALAVLCMPYLGAQALFLVAASAVLLTTTIGLSIRR